MRKRNIAMIVGIIVVILIVVWANRYENVKDNELASRGKITNGVIIDEGRKAKTGSWFKYTYSVHGVN